MIQNTVSGPRLDKLKEELKRWAVEYKLTLYKRLREDYPFGAVKLAPQEQFSRFLEMAGQDYEGLVSQLNGKYLGHPNAYDLVNKELADFLHSMVGIALQMNGDDDA